LNQDDLEPASAESCSETDSATGRPTIPDEQPEPHGSFIAKSAKSTILKETFEDQ
jgi:hypothetical protein